MKKVVLITGSSRGLGKETALIFAEKGYNVILNYHQSEEECFNVKKQIEQMGQECLCIKADIGKEEEVISMFQIIQKKYNTINVLVNNAGITYESMLYEKNKNTFSKVFDVNLLGPFYCMKHGKNIITESIINVSSTNAFLGHPMTIEYDTSKAALLALTKDFAIEYAPKVRVNAIIPGWIKTDMSKIEDEELERQFMEEECKHILVGRYAEAKEIAHIIYFLGSESSSYINGTMICADGGNI